MTKPNPVLLKVLNGASDSNIAFSDLRQLVLSLGFEERIKGSHHIFSKQGVRDIINMQPKGSKAKAYQVKQVRNVILKYRLGGPEDE